MGRHDGTLGIAWYQQVHAGEFAGAEVVSEERGGEPGLYDGAAELWWPGV